MATFPMIEPDGCPRPKRITIARIIGTVAEYFGIEPHLLISVRREWRISHPRQLAMYLAREITYQSLPTIARCFDRDHTTILFACRAVEARILTDKEIAADVLKLREVLTNKIHTAKRDAPMAVIG